MITLYGSIFSPYVRKVLTLCALKKLEVDLNLLNPFSPADKKILLQMNPLGKIPIMQADSFTLSDSSVICAYLERKYPTPSLYPLEAEDYALSLWYEEYADTTLIPTLATIFLNKLVAPKLGLPIDHNALTHALDSLPEIFTYLDAVINKKRYFVGEKFSIADASIWPPFLNYLFFCGYDIDKTRWNNLANYIQTIFTEPCVAKLIKQTQKEFDLRFR